MLTIGRIASPRHPPKPSRDARPSSLRPSDTTAQTAKLQALAGKTQGARPPSQTLETMPSLAPGSNTVPQLPTSPGAEVLRFISEGDNAIKTNQYDVAIRALDSALQLEPDNQIALRSRGVALTRKRECARAIADLERVVVLSPTDALAYGNLASPTRAPAMPTRPWWHSPRRSRSIPSRSSR
jgi:predicted Zn-dependent protease